MGILQQIIILAAFFGYFSAVISQKGSDLEENGSTKTLSWVTNNSIVSDRIRTNGNGFNLTEVEIQALEKFRPLVVNESLLPFHRRDNFLIKFLRTTNLDLQAATELYKTAMEYRRTRDLDKMLNEDWTKWDRLFPFIVSGVHKEQGPVVYILISAYDMRKAVIAGYFNQLIATYDRGFELGTRVGVSIYETTGKNAGLTGIAIIDLANFNLRQHACAGCLPLYAHAINAYERYWPLFLSKLILINVPRSFEVILGIVRPLMSPHTAKALEVYGIDKNEWVPALRRYIDDDQLLVRYGGNRTLSSLTSHTYGRR